jgi:hypothetical protein
MGTIPRSSLQWAQRLSENGPKGLNRVVNPHGVATMDRVIIDAVEGVGL